MGIEPVRWGLLSTARINAAVIPGLKESPDSELVAVASRTDERAAEYAREWDVPRAHGSYEALLEDQDVDAVYISLPNGPHVEWSVRALEAGKHVLCEKPLARDPADVERAFDAADRAGRLLMEAFMWRHHPADAPAARARARRRDRRAAPHTHHLLVHVACRGRAARSAARGRIADGRRLLLRRRRTAPRR